MKVYIRIRYKKLGGHFHCRVFTNKGLGSTYAKVGDLVFDDEEFNNVKNTLSEVEWIDET